MADSNGASQRVKVLYAGKVLLIDVPDREYESVEDLKLELLGDDQLAEIQMSAKLEVWSSDYMTWVSSMKPVSVKGAKTRFKEVGTWPAIATLLDIKNIEGMFSSAPGLVVAGLASLAMMVISSTRQGLHTTACMHHGVMRSITEQKRREFMSTCMWENLTIFGKMLHRLKTLTFSGCGKLIDIPEDSDIFPCKQYCNTTACEEAFRELQLKANEKPPPYPSLLAGFEHSLPFFGQVIGSLVRFALHQYVGVLSWGFNFLDSWLSIGKVLPHPNRCWGKWTVGLAVVVVPCWLANNQDARSGVRRVLGMPREHQRRRAILEAEEQQKQPESPSSQMSQEGES